MADSENKVHAQQADGASGGSWIITIILVVGLIGGALWWRGSDKPPANALNEQNDDLLPRTRQLIGQKTQSLETFNKQMSVQSLLDGYQRMLKGRPVKPEVFEVMSEWMTSWLVPFLWEQAQEKSGSDKFVSHVAMAEVIYGNFPHEDRVGGHTAMFPGTPELSLVVDGVNQDYFRDTGWHWRWIGHALDRMPLERREKLRELNIYGAEELSEFLSVLGVAVVELANREDRIRMGELDVWTVAKRLRETPLDADSVRQILTQLKSKGPDRERKEQRLYKPKYSKSAMEHVLNTLPKPMFVNITQEVGIDFRHESDPELRQRRSVLAVPTGIAGGGVSAGDYDGDGHNDLYLAGTNGGRLYLNVGGKSFEDTTNEAGLVREGETRAGYFVDYDNDGDQDLFVTFVWKSNKLYRNEGNGRFTDVTEETGLGGGKHVTHEAVWFDFDRDGLLDVYVANFGAWTDGASPLLGRDNQSGPPNQLFHHRMDGDKHVFEEVGVELGVDDRGWTHCVGVLDYDRDGWPDLFSMNDFGVSRVYRNREGKRFEEVSQKLGFNLLTNSMNFHLFDLDHTGRMSVYVTQIHKHTERIRYVQPTSKTTVRFERLGEMRALVDNMLFHPDDTGFYRDVHHIWVDPGNFGWAWDASGFDYENDGDSDLLVLNGTETEVPVRDREQRPGFREGRTFISRHGDQNNTMSIFEDGYFYDVSPYCELSYTGNSRGSAIFDFDGDGDLDMAINNYDSPARFYRNEQRTSNNWIEFHLEGTRSNRDAIGARVEIRFGENRRFEDVVSGKGFLSQNPKTLHFGLGKADKVDEMIVIWPSGEKQKIQDLAADKLHLIKEQKNGAGSQ